MEINAQLVKQLRGSTGSGMMDCKKALVETGGDIAAATRHLRAKGIVAPGKKVVPSKRHGVVGGYVHPGSQLGVLVEVNCESEFVARTPDFLNLVHDLGMQVAAANPKYIRKEDITADVLAKEPERQRRRAMQEGKPARLIDKIVEGRIRKFYQEVCLYEQPSIKESSIAVGDLIMTMIARFGEDITVSRFTRMKAGEAQTDNLINARGPQGEPLHE